MCKTMFAIGFDAGREQASVDSMFGGSSGLSSAKSSDDDDFMPL